MAEARSGRLHFTVDYPHVYEELVTNSFSVIGPGIALRLRTVLLGLRSIATIAIEEDHIALLWILSDLGIVEVDDEWIADNPDPRIRRKERDER